MTGPDRERYLDVFRSVALLRVMAYHLVGIAWLSIVFPAMGVMFAVAGSLMARSLARGGGFDVVARRLRRLLPPLWLLGAVAVPAMLWHGWSVRDDADPLRWNELVYWIVPVLDPPGSAWAANATGPLWYVRAYLWFVVLSPALMWAFRRWPVPTVLAPLAVVVVIGVGGLDLDVLGGAGAGVVDFATFGACWLLGFAHRSGALRRLPVAAVVAPAASVALCAGLAWALTHRDAAAGYDLNDIPLAQALWSVGIVLLLMRWSPSTDPVERVPGVSRLVDFLNARAVTLYLWHNVAIDLAWAACAEVGLDRLGPVAVVAAALTLLAAVLFGWVEDIAAGRPVRLLPGLVRRRTGPRRPWWNHGVAVVFSRAGLAALSTVLLTAWVIAPDPPEQPEPTRFGTVGAYLVPWDQDRGLASLPTAAGPLNSLSPVWYTPTDTGGLARNQSSETEPVVRRAESLGLDVIPSISNYRDDHWDAALVHQLVNDPRLRAVHVAAITGTVRTFDWDGIDIDYEALSPVDYPAFGAFLRELGDALHADSRRLTAALPAVTADDPRGVAGLYALAGAAVDEVRVMAYDHAWSGSGPGPIAPVSWVADVVRFAVRHVPRDRLVLGLAAHGYDWNAGSTRPAESLMFADAVTAAERYGSSVYWDTDAQAPWFAYLDGAEQHAVWFEDAPSLAAKVALVDEYDLGGVFLWRLGGEDPALWRLLAARRDQSRASASRSGSRPMEPRSSAARWNSRRSNASP